MSNETPNVEPDSFEKAGVSYITMDMSVLDDMDFEKLKPILLAILQNVTVLNYMVAEIAAHVGFDFAQEPNSSPGEDHTGMYL